MRLEDGHYLASNGDRITAEGGKLFRRVESRPPNDDRKHIDLVEVAFDQDLYYEFRTPLLRDAPIVPLSEKDRAWGKRVAEAWSRELK